jgi:DNA polymerase I-like protein with 3'-5' exonuclease and polymerase domains
MVALFERPNDPPYYGSNHLMIFDTLHPKMFAEHGKKVKDVYESTWYQWVKNGNFAVQYGAVDKDDGEGTADLAYHVKGAQKRIAARFTKIHGKGGLNQRMIAHAEQHGYVETIPDKTVDPTRGYPLLCTRTNYGKIKPTVPLNYHVQGTAMWWMGKAMVRCHNYLQDLPDYHLVMQVHDELVFDFPKGTAKDSWRTNLPVVREIQGLMEQGGNDIGIPTPVSLEYHDSNWSEGITIS